MGGQFVRLVEYHQTGHDRLAGIVGQQEAQTGLSQLNADLRSLTLRGVAERKERGGTFERMAGPEAGRHLRCGEPGMARPALGS